MLRGARSFVHKIHIAIERTLFFPFASNDDRRTINLRLGDPEKSEIAESSSSKTPEIIVTARQLVSVHKGRERGREAFQVGNFPQKLCQLRFCWYNNGKEIRQSIT